MIEVYLKTNTDYDKNGDITLDPTSCTYKNSENLVTLEHFLDDEGRWKYIDFENVIAAEENGKKKLYRIYNVVRSLYSITAYARPIFYDLIDKVLIDVRPTNKNGEEALNIILKDTGFTGHSNISSINTAYYARKNIVEAISGDDDNSFLNRWGGELYVENFDVYIYDKIGLDNGVRVEFGYNLNEIEADVNIEEVVTRIIPVGYDGIMLEGDTPWVDSPLIKKYTHPKMRVIEFSDIKVKESEDDEEGFDTIEEARAELIRQCNILFENEIDKPTVNYKIDMINLANTAEYKNFKMLVNVNKGDTVTCYIKHLDIDVKARVIDYEIDLITGEYLSIELGNVISNFFNEQADIQSKINNILNDNGSVKAESLEGIINAMDTKFKAMRDIATKQHVRAMLFEDNEEGSPTYGAMCIGSMGFEIASEKVPGSNEWKWSTFGSGQGFFADWLVGKLMTVLITNTDHSFEIDLTKPGGALFRNNGKDAIKIENNQIKLYNWAKNADFIGSLGALIQGDDSNKPLIGLWNDTDAAVAIGYKDKEDNTVPTYIVFDKYNILGESEVYPILVKEKVKFGKDIEVSKIDASIIKSNVYYDKEMNPLIQKNYYVGETGALIRDNLRIEKDLMVVGKIRASEVEAGTKIYSLDGQKVIYPIENTRPYKPSQGLIEIIKHFEGCKLEAYQDTGGIWTIGIGHTGTVDGVPIHSGMTITKEKAEELLQDDLLNRGYVGTANNTTLEDYTQEMFDALVDFNFNCGTAYWSEIQPMLDDGDINGVCSYIEQFVHDDKGNYLEGLARRRRAEKELLLNGRYTDGNGNILWEKEE